MTVDGEAGASTDRIMDHTGHKSPQVVKAYSRRTHAFGDHAADRLL